MNEENSAPVCQKELYESDRYALYTQRGLEIRKKEGRAVCGDVTPDLLVQLKNVTGEESSDTTDFTTIAVDATITGNGDAQFKEKKEKYKKPVADHFIMIYCKDDGSNLQYCSDTKLPDKVRENLKSLFGLEFVKKKKILKHGAAQNDIYEREHKTLNSELDYWDFCKQYDKIVRSRRCEK